MIRLYILLEAANRRIEGAAVAGKLRDRGCAVNLRSVRRILREPEDRGYLLSTEVRNGRPGLVYNITRNGRLQLRAARQRIRDLIEILGGSQ